MLSRSLAVLVAAATVSLAKTPSGFNPASNTDLVVEYGNIAAMNGILVSKEASANQPTIGTTTQLTGSKYMVIMVDLDIPTNSPPATNTLLHWMQTGLTPSTTTKLLNTTTGMMTVFLLENTANTTALASYIGPGPPARTPLSHRYTQILVDHSSISAAGLSTLQTAAMTRVGFNAQTVLSQAGLDTKVVAGNSFNVTNPGPAQDSTSNSTTGSGTAGTVTTAGAARSTGSAVLGLLMAGAVFLAL